MGHDHGGSLAGAVTAGARHRKRLLIAFGLTAAYMLVELVTGRLTGSLALLSDAAHMGTDVLGLGMALAAITLAQRSSTSQHTYGTYRLEVLAALANGLLLFGVAGYVLYEAWQRLTSPPAVPGLPLLVVASIGLVVNLISFRLLAAGAKESLNLKGAYLEVLSDMLGSVGVIIAAIIIYTTGWRYADPLIGASIGLFILPRTFKLTAQALRILMQIAPAGLNVKQVQAAILALPGVADVHDLHIWTVTSGLETASGHVVLAEGADLHEVLDRVSGLLASEYQVTHATIQCEPADHQDHASPI
jgi:cobalt-zinc-cadmium efflux system protein